MVMLVLLYVLCQVTLSHATYRCGNDRNVPLPSTFKLTQTCARSTVRVLEHATLPTPLHCAQLALERKGLAFNFNRRNSSCFVLQCPEFDKMTYLREAWPFDYYSQYTDSVISVNFSCVPGLGMFRLHQERCNFTEAQRRCRSGGGILAGVHSESRTSALSSLLASQRAAAGPTSAYIGLDDRHAEGKFLITGMAAEPLSCHEYRAWGPGEPRDREEDQDCGVLNIKRQWAVTSCSHRLPFICELLPLDHCASLHQLDMKQQCIRESFPSVKRRRVNQFQQCREVIHASRKSLRLPQFYTWVASLNMSNVYKRNKG